MKSTSTGDACGAVGAGSGLQTPQRRPGQTARCWETAATEEGKSQCAAWRTVRGARKEHGTLSSLPAPPKAYTAKLGSCFRPLKISPVSHEADLCVENHRDRVEKRLRHSAHEKTFSCFLLFFFFIKKGWRITDLANRLFLVERKVRQQLSASTFSQKSHLEPSNFVSPTENYVPIIFLALWLPSHSRRWVLPSLLVVVSWEPVLLLLTVLTVDSTKCANKTTPQVGKQKGYECTLWCGSKLLLDITRNTSGYIPSSPQLAFSVLPLAPPSRQ